jgi:propanediol utilization protein
MKKELTALTAAAAIAFSGAVFAQPGTGKMVEAMGGGDVTAVTAQVQAVDLAKRIVTLKGPEGNVFDVKVGDEVRNLPQVKVGDMVVAKYFEAVAIEVKKGGLGIRSAESQTAVSRAQPGERPAGGVATTTTIVANVLKVDSAKQVVTLEGPSGKSVKVKVKDPAVFKEIKAGEQVEMTITEAFAIAVEAPRK